MTVTREQIERKIEQRIARSAQQLEALEQSYKPQMDGLEEGQQKMLKLIRKVQAEIQQTEETRKALETEIPKLNKEYLAWASKWAGSEQLLIGLKALEDKANRILDMYQRQLGQIHNEIAAARKKADPKRIRANMLETWRIRQLQGDAVDINMVFKPGSERELFEIVGPSR
jgi:chromosome segregation ATPase